MTTASFFDLISAIESSWCDIRSYEALFSSIAPKNAGQHDENDALEQHLDDHRAHQMGPTLAPSMARARYQTPSTAPLILYLRGIPPGKTWQCRDFVVRHELCANLGKEHRRDRVQEPERVMWTLPTHLAAAAFVCILAVH